MKNSGHEFYAMKRVQGWLLNGTESIHFEREMGHASCLLPKPFCLLLYTFLKSNLITRTLRYMQV